MNLRGFVHISHLTSHISSSFLVCGLGVTMSSCGRFNVPPFRHGHQHSRPSHRHDHRQPLPRPPPTIEEKRRVAEAICADVQDSTNANIPLVLAQEKESCESDEEFWSDPEEDRRLAMIPINMQSKANR